MDWYSHWIEKHVLVQNICLHGSNYASLHFGHGCNWWTATAIFPLNVT
jgi:hypothetical protein